MMWRKFFLYLNLRKFFFVVLIYIFRIYNNFLQHIFLCQCNCVQCTHYILGIFYKCTFHLNLKKLSDTLYQHFLLVVYYFLVRKSQNFNYLRREKAKIVTTNLLTMKKYVKFLYLSLFVLGYTKISEEEKKTC